MGSGGVRPGSEFATDPSHQVAMKESQYRDASLQRRCAAEREQDAGGSPWVGTLLLYRWVWWVCWRIPIHLCMKTCWRYWRIQSVFTQRLFQTFPLPPRPLPKLPRSAKGSRVLGLAWWVGVLCTELVGLVLADLLPIPNPPPDEKR